MKLPFSKCEGCIERSKKMNEAVQNFVQGFVSRVTSGKPLLDVKPGSGQPTKHVVSIKSGEQ